MILSTQQQNIQNPGTLSCSPTCIKGARFFCNHFFASCIIRKLAQELRRGEFKWQADTNADMLSSGLSSYNRMQLQTHLFYKETMSHNNEMTP